MALWSLRTIVCSPVWHSSNPGHPKHGQETAAPWWRTWFVWKRIIQTGGILSGIAYALVTYLQWRDLGNNFRIDQRALIKIEAAFAGALVSTVGVKAPGGQGR